MCFFFFDCVASVFVCACACACAFVHVIGCARLCVCLHVVWCVCPWSICLSNSAQKSSYYKHRSLHLHDSLHLLYLHSLHKLLSFQSLHSVLFNFIIPSTPLTHYIDLDLSIHYFPSLPHSIHLLISLTLVTLHSLHSLCTLHMASQSAIIVVYDSHRFSAAPKVHYSPMN